MRLTSLRTAKEEWKKNAAYVDTLCLPVYGFQLINKEPGLDEMEAVERITARLEQELAGRLLLLPPLSYIGKNKTIVNQYLQETIASFSEAQFHHMVIISPKGHLEAEAIQPEGIPFTLKLLPIEIDNLSLEDSTEVTAIAESLRNEIVRIWMEEN